MIPQLRRQQILRTLQGREVAYLADLVQESTLSESTVRRDLKQLEKSGEIELLRGGGIRLINNNYEKDVLIKLRLQQAEKARIARLAATLVHPGDVIFLDPSSANSLLIGELPGKRLTVVTNSLMHINQLLKLGIPCIMIGGQIKEHTMSCIGPGAERSLGEYRFSKSFLGANGMDLRMGITNHDPGEQAIKRLAISNSVSTYFLIDSSKYGVVNMCRVAAMDECVIITDKRLAELAACENILYAE
ncbi:MAG: DeoR/GlpR family DNA-binding transcription regulator [Christensenellales bacterium]